MKRYRGALVGVGMTGTMAIAGCGDYATKDEVRELRAQLVATHDTMVALWTATDSINRVFQLRDTVPVPPRPKMPGTPLRFGQAQP